MTKIHIRIDLILTEVLNLYMKSLSNELLFGPVYISYDGSIATEFYLDRVLILYRSYIEFELRFDSIFLTSIWTEFRWDRLLISYMSLISNDFRFDQYLILHVIYISDKINFVPILPYKWILFWPSFICFKFWNNIWILFRPSLIWTEFKFRAWVLSRKSFIRTML